MGNYSIMGIGVLMVPGLGSGGDPYPGYDWYVDSVNGNDDNTGTSSLQAFATIAKLETVLQAGDLVGLAKGSVWREQLDIPGDGGTVAAYGSGNAPLLDCSDICANASFTKTGGQTNVYQIAVTLAAASAVTYVNFWEGGVSLARAANVAACDTTPGSYYPSAEGGSITLYIHPSGSTDPATDGKVYEISARHYGLAAFQRSGLTLRGVRARRNLHNNGSIVVGRSCNLYDCSAEDGGKHNIYFSGGCYLEGCIARNAANNAGTLYILYDGVSGAGLDVTLVNCQAILDNYKLCAGFYDHAAGDRFGTVAYNGCTATNCSTGFNSLGATLLSLVNCTTVGCAVGAGPEVATSIAGGSLGVVNRGTSNERCINMGNSCPSLVVDGASFSHGANGTLIYTSRANTVVTVRNCTFPAASYPFYLDAAGITLTLDHNTWGNVTRIYRVGTGATLTVDYNTYGTGNFSIGGVLYEWAAYRAAFPALDANSTHP